MMLAAVDRLVHNSTILEMNVESYRRCAGINRNPGWPMVHATISRATQGQSKKRRQRKFLRSARINTIIAGGGRRFTF